MRTTLNIDEDLLAAAREIARREGLPTGVVVSRLLRRSLTSHATPASTGEGKTAAPAETVAGFRPFPAEGELATDELVNSLRDQEGV